MEARASRLKTQSHSSFMLLTQQINKYEHNNLMIVFSNPPLFTLKYHPRYCLLTPVFCLSLIYLINKKSLQSLLKGRKTILPRFHLSWLTTRLSTDNGRFPGYPINTKVSGSRSRVVLDGWLQGKLSAGGFPSLIKPKSE